LKLRSTENVCVSPIQTEAAVTSCLLMSRSGVTKRLAKKQHFDSLIRRDRHGRIVARKLDLPVAAGGPPG
jgi:hypothetical protein